MPSREGLQLNDDDDDDSGIKIRKPQTTKDLEESPQISVVG